MSEAIAWYERNAAEVAQRYDEADDGRKDRAGDPADTHRGRREARAVSPWPGLRGPIGTNPPPLPPMRTFATAATGLQNPYYQQPSPRIFHGFRSQNFRWWHLASNCDL